MLNSVCTEPVMPSPASKNSSPQPGEIWETDRGYVMIVRSQETTFTVMGLSTEPSDAIISAQISGLDQDLFADTTNIFHLSRPSLLRQRGDRLSRQLYDELMTLGDNLEAQQWAQVVLQRSLQIEQTLQQLKVTPINRPPRYITLSQWLQNRFEPNWLAIDALTTTGTLHLSTPTRTQDDTTDPDPVQLLIERIRSAPDDESLWAAVEELWQIDPGNPAAGVRRVQLLDLGLQVSGRTVALAIAILRRADQRFGVMLRVYPTNNEPYVPETLKLILIDVSGQTYEVTARRNDLYIQLKFNGNPSESFRVRVALGDAQITEEFVL
jgi:hypothetical protein